MKKENSISGFFEWILNDEKIVFKLLYNMSLWFGIIIFILLAFVFYYFNFIILAVIFGIFGVFALYRCFNFYVRFGGNKNMPKISAGKMVWGKKFKR